MNQRIKQLAERAEKYADDNFKGEPTYSEAYDSKFAELIVQECIDCVRGAVLTDEVAVKNNLGFNDGLSAAVVNVQKHFGVEE
jgi:hypothetical protein